MNEAPALRLPPLAFDLRASHDWARRMWLLFVGCFYSSRELAERRYMLREERDQLLRWLRPLEAFARRLIFIEAARLPKPNSPPPQPAPRRRVHYSCGRPGFAQPDPARWGVIFKVTEPWPRPASKRKRARRPEFPSRLVRTDNAAERIEALRRALDDPMPYAQRLARRLHFEPHRPVRLIRPEQNYKDLMGADVQREAHDLACFLRWSLPPPPQWRPLDSS